MDILTLDTMTGEPITTRSDKPGAKPTGQTLEELVRSTDWEQEGNDFLAVIVDSAGQIVGSFGTNSEAAATQSQAIADYNAQVIANSAANAQLEAAEREAARNQTLAVFAVSAFVMLGFLWFLFNRKK